MTCRVCLSESLSDGPLIDGTDAPWQVCADCGSYSSPYRYRDVCADYGQKYIDQHYTGNHTREEILEECHENADVILQLAPGPRVLDIGCCDCSLLERLLNAGCDVYGFDVMPESARIVPALSDRIVIDRLFSARHFGPMDAVVIREVIEHLPDWKDTLTEAASLLNPRGILHVQTPLPTNTEPHPWNQRLHLQIFSEPALRAAFNKLGLRIIPDGCKTWDGGQYLTGRKQ